MVATAGGSDRELAVLAEAELQDVLRRIPEAELGALALAVDEDLTSVFAASAPREWLDDLSNADYRYWPPDWPNTELGPLADTNSCLRRRASESANMVEHVQRSFDSLAVALGSLRQRGDVGTETLLFVVSLDPGETTERLAKEAVRSLNGEGAHQAWVEVWG